jgi:hypothetical protein
MTSYAFDTLKYANTLKAAGVPEQQAEAGARALQDVLEVNLGDLATREQLYSAKDHLRTELAQVESRLEVKIAETKAELVRWVVAVGLLQTTVIAALLLRLLPA